MSEEERYAKSLEIAKCFEEKYEKKGYKIKKEYAEGGDKLTDIYADSEKWRYAIEKITLFDTYAVYFVQSLETLNSYSLFKYNISDESLIEDWDTEKKYSTPDKMFEIADKREHELNLR